MAPIRTKKAMDDARAALRSRAVSEMREALGLLPARGEMASRLRKQLREALRAAPTEPRSVVQTERSASCVSDGIGYRFRIGSLDSPAVFSVSRDGAEIEVVLNRDHHFVKRFAIERDDWKQPAVLTLLAAWARYELEQPDTKRSRFASDARIDWGRVARRLLVVDPEFGCGKRGR